MCSLSGFLLELRRCYKLIYHPLSVCIPGIVRVCLFYFLLLITFCLPLGSLSLNTIFLVLFVDIIIPYFDVMFYNMCTEVCNKVSDSGIIT